MSSHPAAAVIETLRDAPSDQEVAAALPHLLDIADAVLAVFATCDDHSQDGLRACDVAWRRMRIGAAHLAGKRHISEA